MRQKDMTDNGAETHEAEGKMRQGRDEDEKLERDPGNRNIRRREP